MRFIIPLACTLITFIIYMLYAADGIYTLNKEQRSEGKTLAWYGMRDKPVAVYTDRLQFANRSKTLRFSRSFFSPDGNMAGFVNSRQHKEDTSLEVKWFDTQGTIAGKFDERWHYDIALPEFFLPSGGEFLISVDMSARVRLIDSKDGVVSSFSLLEDYHYNPENNIIVDLSRNSEILLGGIITVEPSQNAFPNINSTIALYDLNGQQQYTLQYPDQQLYALDLDPDGNRAAFCLYNQVSEDDPVQFKSVFLNSAGGVIADLPLKFRKAYFDDDNQYLFLMDKSDFYFFDPVRGEITAHISASDDQQLFMIAEPLHDLNLIMLLEGSISKNEHGWSYNDINLRTFTNQGKEVDFIILDNISMYQPALRYNAEQKSVFIGHSSGWKQFGVTYQR